MFSNFVFSNISNSLSFSIKNVDISIINGIRRTLITDIPIIGFVSDSDDKSILIHHNNTSLNNEILENRISMIPIHLNDEENENYVDDSFKIELNQKFNSTDILQLITTQHFTVFFNDKEVDKNKYFPQHPVSKHNILITKLRKGEHIHFQATAQKKTARFNASFNPVSGCSYYFNFHHDDKLNPLDNERNYTRNKYGEPDEVIFSFEINNGLTHRYLFNKAIDIIIQKIIIIKEELEQLTNHNKIQHISKYSDNCFDFTFNNEDDTIGNILQSFIHNYCVRDQNLINGRKCLYCGYLNVHPLQNIIKLRITLDDNDELLENVFTNFLANICEEIHKHLTNIKNNWIETSIKI